MDVTLNQTDTTDTETTQAVGDRPTTRDFSVVRRFMRQRGLPPMVPFFLRLSSVYLVVYVAIYGLLAITLPIQETRESLFAQSLVFHGRFFVGCTILTVFSTWIVRDQKLKPKWMTKTAIGICCTYLTLISMIFVNGIATRTADASQLAFVIAFITLSSHTYLATIWWYTLRATPVAEHHWKLHDMALIAVAFFAFVGTILYSQNPLFNGIGQLLAIWAFSLQFGKLTYEYLSLREP